MERIPQLIKHLETDMTEITQAWIKQLNQIETTTTKEALQHIKTSADVDSGIVITYLRSSYVTESHHFKLAIYQKEPFTNPPLYQTFLDMKFLYVQIASYMEILIKKLTPPYVRILSYEKEEIRRTFTAKLYEESYHFFERVLTELESEDKKIPVYFGEEMGQLITIGAM